MSDTECNLEELTAFLEASDEEEKDETSQNEQMSSKQHIAQDKHGADNCSLEAIEAFLEESDDSDDEEEEIKHKTRLKDTNEDQMSDFEEYDDAAVQELENMMDDEMSACDVSDKCDTVKTRTQPENQSSQSESGNSSSEMHSLKCSVIDDTTVSQSEMSDCQSSASGESVQDQIRAEMEAMQKRMLELQAMLVSQQPSPSTSLTTPQNQSSKKMCTSKENTSNKTSEDKTSVAKNGSNSKDTCVKQIQRTSVSGTVSSPSVLKHKPSSSRTPGTNRISRTVTQSQCSTTNDSFIAGSSDSPKQFKKSSVKVAPIEDEENPFFNSNPVVSQTDNVKTNMVETLAAPVDSKSLFGESDDSDWDELDGEEKSKLSKEGKDIKKLLHSGPRQREAHTPKYDTQILKKTSPNSISGAGNRWLDKPIGNLVGNGQSFDSPSQKKSKYSLKEEYKTRPSPNLSTNNTDNAECVTDPYCGIRIVNPRISMTSFKSKMEGRTMLKVSRVASKHVSVDLQKGNWVTIGVVVHRSEPRQSAAGKTYCIWKLSDLIDCDNTITFFLFGNVYKDHWKNDIGTVIGLLNPTAMDKAEKAQSETAFTISHPQQLLVMGISKDLGRCRGTTKAGNPCSSFINKTQGEFCTYHVQSAYRKMSSKRTELQASTGVQPKAFQQQKKRGSGAGCYFYGGQTFTTSLPQARAGQDKVTLKKLQNQAATKGVGKVTTMSLHELKPEDEIRLKKLSDKEAGLLDLLSVPTPGSMNFVRHLVKKEKVAEDNAKEKAGIIQSVSAKDLLKEHQQKMKEKMAERKRPSPLTATPILGKGFQPGMEISLGSSGTRTQASSAERAKLLAISKIQSSGGIQKEDPNAVRKKLTSPEMKEKVRKRAAEHMDQGETEKGDDSPQPPKKRSKLLGNIDLNSPEVQKLLKVKSKHTGALAEAEAEHEEKYFMELEKKERVEEKMDSIKEVAVTAVQCLKCQYKAFTLADRCKSENHPTKTVKATKRFFKCKNCKRRSVSLDKIETKPCKNCGSTCYERTSMLKEKSGPKLESEQLSLRGNEQKFLNSINQKSYLNV